MKLRKIAAAVIAAAMMTGIGAGFSGCANKEGGETFEEAASVISEIRDIPSIELVKEMKIGWNLGNTLDSTKSSPSGEESAQDWETAWGQPVTTKAMIDSVKAKGFNVLRVPVTWEGKFGEGPSYEIREDWMNRVQEIVDYGIDNDMFVILNMHHEEWNMPTYENEAAADEMLRALWAQIAAHFGGYSEKLIFEGMNEPRLKGTPMEWNGGNEEARDVINHWNAAFVETVRAAGGNNEKRHLMIPTYAASTSASVLDSFVIPEGDDKIIVSVHAYLPYNFALADDAQCKKEWSADDPSDTNPIEELAYDLNDRYISKGQAVIIGEFGTRNRNGLNTAAREACGRFYTSTMRQFDIPCVWWDNNAFIGKGENFGLLDRKSMEWRYPTIVDAIIEGANS